MTLVTQHSQSSAGCSPHSSFKSSPPVGVMAHEHSASPGAALDLDYIRRSIQIELVGRLLGLEINARHYSHCFRPSSHRNGDTNPSLHFLVRKNCAICFGCDSRAMHTIDLVLAVLAARGQPHSLPDAIRWFRREFGNLPTLRGRPAGIVRDKPFRAGVGDELEDLIRSGVFATLSDKARSVLFAIYHLRDASGRARLPYPTLRRYTGIGSDHTIRRALNELVAVHIIEIHKGRTDFLEPQNIYLLTPRHPDLVRTMQETYEKNREAIANEVRYYREAKRARRRKQPEPLISWDNSHCTLGCSSEVLHRNVIHFQKSA